MHVKAIVKKADVGKDGRTKIYFALRHQGKERLLDSEKRIDPNLFDNDAGLPKRSYANYTALRNWLMTKIDQLEGIILEIENNGKPLTYEAVKEKFLSGDSTLVINFCRQELERERPLLAKRTLQDYKRCIDNFADYKPAARFSDIDRDFLEEYRYYLEKVKSLSVNSIAHDLRTLRKYFNLALHRGVTNAYPFTGFRIRTEETEKDYCTPEELDLLHTIYDSGQLSPRLQKTLANYLFSCETGISADDMRNKGRLNFKENEVSFIRGKTKKKGKITKIPYTKRAKKLLPLVRDGGNLKQKLHRVHEDLKEIMDIAGIKKHITYHTSRSSLYVLAKSREVDDRVISEILGHSSIVTTEKYKRIEDGYLREQMGKIDR